MTFAFRKSLLLGMVCLIATVSGCGGKQEEGPEMGQVSGTIKYKGQPAKKATVVFHPDLGTDANGLPASGETDDDGHYTLRTIKPGDGARLGKYKVTVELRGPDKPLPAGQTSTGMPGANTMPGDPIIPQKYFQPHTTDLAAEVKSGSNTHDFELKD